MKFPSMRRWNTTGASEHAGPARLAACAAILLLAALAQAQPPKLPTVRVESLSYVPVPLMIAQSRGIFRKYGIEVQNGVEPSSAMLRAKLASGKIDIGIASVDNGVGMRTINHADSLIVMGGSMQNNHLIVQPSIHSIAQLRGRVTIVDAVNTAFALQLEKILLSHGLRAGRDYKVKSIGTQPERLRAMRENRHYAASMFGGEFAILARQEGFHSLGSTRALIGPFQGTGAIVLRQWARAHADTLERYMAAYIEAQRWMLVPAHKRQVLALLVGQSHLSAAVASRMYARIVSKTHPAYEPDARVNIPGFENVLKLRAEIEGEWKGKPPSVYEFYDPVYYRKALAMVKAREESAPMGKAHRAEGD